jgi:hypothetical protein
MHGQAWPGMSLTACPRLALQRCVDSFSRASPSNDAQQCAAHHLNTIIYKWQRQCHPHGRRMQQMGAGLGGA